MLYNLIDNILYNLCNKNDSIIIYLNSEFHILEHFSHIIKKKHIKIYIITFDNNTIYTKLIENIKNEECERNIDIYMNIKDLQLSKSNNGNNEIKKVFIFDLNNYIFFNKILQDINYLEQAKLLDLSIYLYCYLSNENVKSHIFKKLFINNFRNLSKSMGIDLKTIFNMHDILDIINSNNMDVTKINIIDNKNYIFIGNYIFYEIAFNLI